VTKSLFKVRIEAEFEMCVLAENVEEAHRVASKNIQNELDNLSGDVFYVNPPKLIRSEADIPENWEDACPYGEKGDVGDMTVGEIARVVGEIIKVPEPRV
jgi:hypothetical protein